MKERRREGRAALSMQRLVKLLAGKVIWGSKHLSKTHVSGCFAADLMSDVLAFSKPGMLLLTGLTTVQSVHAADVAELRGIIFVSGKTPEHPVIDLAKKKGIPLVRTKHNLLDACGILYEAGVGTNLK